MAGNGTATAILTRSSARIPAMFPWPCDSLEVPQRGCGLGNPLTTMAKNIAEPWREQIGFWVFKRDAGTGALVLTGESKIQYFTTGEGEPPPASTPLPTFGQNRSSTNLFQKGAPVSRDNLFAAVALGVSIGRPFALTKDQAGAYLAKKSYAPWVDAYGRRARDLIWTNVGFNVSYRDAAANFELGNIENYPPAGGQYGAETVRAGGGFGVFGMLPIGRGPVYFGAQDEQNQATLEAISCPETIEIDNDAMAQTVSDIALPMHIWAYGDYGPWCGPCAPSSDEIDTLVQKRVNAAMMAAGLLK